MKIKREDIVDIIIGEVAAINDLNSTDYDTDLSDLGVDSLDRNSIFLDLEENFNVEFSDDEVDNLNTINKIAVFINDSEN